MIDFKWTVKGVHEYETKYAPGGYGMAWATIATGNMTELIHAVELLSPAKDAAAELQALLESGVTVREVVKALYDAGVRDGFLAGDDEGEAEGAA